MAIRTPAERALVSLVCPVTSAGLVMCRTIAAAAAVGIFCGEAAWAQAWRLEPAVKATAVVTDNVDFSASNRQADAVLVVTPALRVLGRGPGYEVTGSLAADGLFYLGRSRGDRIFPQAGLAARSQLVDRLLFLDGDLSLRTTATDAFGPLGDGPTVLNRSTIGRLHVAPRIERELSPDSRILLRTDHTWTRGYGSQESRIANDAYIEAQTGLYELQPRPLGLRLSIDRQRTEYTQQGDNRIEIRTARATGLYTADQELIWGLTIGRDEGFYGTNEVRDTLRGGRVRWIPSERTTLDAVYEKRFFGNGWDVSLNHRSPYVAITASLVRTVSTYASSLGTLSAGQNVAALLDALLITRVPDAAQRATAVQDIIARRGLPETLSSTVELYSGTAQLVQGGNLSLVWMGNRHTVTTQFYAQRTRDLVGPDDVLPVSGDATQRGVTTNISRRLTPDLSADVGIVYARVKGLGLNEGRDTRNVSWRTGFTQTLSPRTTLSGSLRYQIVDTDSPPGVSADGTPFAASSSHATATSLSAGVLHRF